MVKLRESFRETKKKWKGVRRVVRVLEKQQRSGKELGGLREERGEGAGVLLETRGVGAGESCWSYWS